MRQAAWAVVMFAGVAQAADGDLTPLHPTRSVTAAPTAFWRPSRYDVWQLYAPDRSGAFKPRVVPGPVGPYYLQTGQPYHQWPLSERAFIPMMVD